MKTLSPLMLLLFLFSHGQSQADSKYETHKKMKDKLLSKDVIIYDSEVADKDIKPEVDLSYQFQPKVDLQLNGSCHVFAGVALFEASCYRRLKVRLDIDEDSLFTQHLLQRILENKGELLFEELKSQIEGYQGGQSIFTIDRLLDGFACEQGAFTPSSSAIDKLSKYIVDIQANTLVLDMKKIKPMTYRRDIPIIYEITGSSKLDVEPKPRNDLERKYVDAVIKSTNHYRKYLEQDKLHKKYSSSFIDSVMNLSERREITKRLNFHSERTIHYSNLASEYENELKRRFAEELPKYYKLIRQKLTSLVDLPISYEALSDDYKKCVSLGMKSKIIEKPSQAQMIELLDKGIPFVCGAKIAYEEDSIEVSLKKGYHAFNVVGYRKNPKALPNGIEFKTRDSNRMEHLWGWSLYNCDMLEYIE